MKHSTFNLSQRRPACGALGVSGGQIPLSKMTRQIVFIFITFLLFDCSSTKNKTTDSSKSAEPNYLVTGYYYLAKNSDKFQRQLFGTTRKYNINPVPIITVDNFSKVSVDKNNFGNYYLRIDLDKSGGQKWSEGTGNNIGDSLAIVVNNELIQVARVNGQITAPVTTINREGLTKSQADKYLADIKAKMIK